MPSFPGFLAGSAPSQSPLATSERTVNWYLERVGTQGTQHKLAMYPTPGFSTWNTTPTSDLGCRAALAVNDLTYVMMGAGLYLADVTRTLTLKKTLVQDGNPAQMVYNGPTGGQLCISTGTNGYNYTIATNTLTTVLAGTATQVGMLDEYFLALDRVTGTLRLSDLNDGTTWDPTQFAMRSSQPDPWIAVGVNGPDIILLGGLTGDVWYDAGSSPFPLAERVGLTIPFGIAAPFSLAQTGGVLYWLAQNKDGAGLVVKMSGYSPEPITTPEVASEFSTYARTSTIADAEAMVCQVESHVWYVLRFPTANHTWVYDITTGIWFEWGKWNSLLNDYDVAAPRTHVYSYGLHLTGDDSTGTLAVMDVTNGSELDGTAIRRLRRGPVLIHDSQRVPVKKFEVLVQPGLGLQTGQGSNPQMMLRTSSDGGMTWGNERAAGTGAVGHYGQLVHWRRFGAPRWFVPELTATDPVPYRVMDAFFNNDPDLG